MTAPSRLGALLLLVLLFAPSCESFQEIGWRFSLVGQTTHCQQQTIRRHSTALNMKVRVGILGLPNVGKSTLFNALAQKSIAQAANFPFCTIEPNLAPIAVPDEYLDRLGTFANSIKTVPATMEWVDVAGLAKGAHRGEGLGNRFLASLRECDAICHLVRTFEDEDIVHVDGMVDPAADAEVINLELLLADEAHAERRLQKTTCQGEERETLEKVVAGLKEGIPARAIGLSASEAFSIKSMGLLTLKLTLYAFNVDEVDFTLGKEDAFTVAEGIFQSIEYCDPNMDMFTLVSAKIEAELSARERHDQMEYLESLGVELEPGQDFDDLLSFRVLPSLVRKLLGLSLVYTGPGVPPERSKTTKAYMFSQGSMTAEGLAGRLHGDLKKGFIRAEVASAGNLIEHDSYTKAKDSGCIRTEGREYVLTSGDVVLIKYK